jgi:holo-[acyl-carrier protein] synthase
MVVMTEPPPDEETPPTPSPAPVTGTVVGLGIDLCDVEKLRTAMTRTPRFRDRVFTAGEQAYCERRRDPGERYAARFAAKEAVLKALGVGLGACALREIEVVTQSSGAPRLVLHGAAAQLAAERGVTAWLVSLTHTGGMAAATAVALGGSA